MSRPIPKIDWESTNLLNSMQSDPTFEEVNSTTNAPVTEPDTPSTVAQPDGSETENEEIQADEE